MAYSSMRKYNTGLTGTVTFQLIYQICLALPIQNGLQEERKIIAGLGYLALLISHIEIDLREDLRQF
jgi:hypothetical protein